MKVIETHGQIETEEKIRTGFNQLMNFTQEIALFEHLHFLVNYCWGGISPEGYEQHTKMHG